MADVGTTSGGGGRSLEVIAIIAVLAVGGWLVWRRLAKPAPIRATPPAPSDKPPELQDTGEVRRGSPAAGVVDVPAPAVSSALVTERPSPVSAPAGAVATAPPVAPQQPRPVSSTTLGTEGRPAPVLVTTPIEPKPSPPPSIPLGPVGYTAPAPKPAYSNLSGGSLSLSGVSRL
jgi:hypothetical protein